jgi:hypothetical protein
VHNSDSTIPKTIQYNLTKELVSYEQKNKKPNFIYGTRIPTKQIWNNFSASPDLELLLAKTKKELQQAPSKKVPYSLAKS